ncbi:unnamed protein product, partial [Ectocarpus sp. 8 AP-2014]
CHTGTKQLPPSLLREDRQVQPGSQAWVAAPSRWCIWSGRVLRVGNATFEGGDYPTGVRYHHRYVQYHRSPRDDPIKIRPTVERTSETVLRSGSYAIGSHSTHR